MEDQLSDEAFLAFWERETQRPGWRNEHYGSLAPSQVAPSSPFGRRETFLDDLAVERQALQQAQLRIARLVGAEADRTRTESSVLLQGAIDERVLVSEIAHELQITERASQNLVGRSRILTGSLTATLAAVGSAEITLRHAELIVDASCGLPGEAVAEFEAAALAMARDVTPPKLARKLVALQNRLRPECAIERRIASQDERRIEIAPALDGMAWLNAYLPAEQVIAIDARLTAIAQSLRAAGDEHRTQPQLRADSFSALLLRDESGHARIRPTLFVTVPAATLTGDDQPGELHGYGPIDADTARRLAATAPSFFRVLTAPDCRSIVQVDERSRTIPAALSRWLRLRDGTCRFPGCNRNVVGCDIDHTVGFAPPENGPTAPHNLAHLCRKHHRLKHLAGWQVRQDAAGTLTWTSPHGGVRVTRPEVELPAMGKPPPF